ncbi:MAG: 16S rRNA (uracil(1498)-N(3))-methyltransferase [Cellvibrionales bacterium]|nr:16S rRNA (uracil(1498)-N(3))-methyltransferase [Cellvibrionales bacterium]
MRTHRLYVDMPLAVDSEIQLDKQASHYLGTVLRVKSGQALNVFNNQGGCYEAVVQSASKKSVVIKTSSFDPNDRMPLQKLSIAIGVTKGDRMDTVMQKATELGVHGIQPLWMDYCDVKLPKERLEKKLQHWRQITVSASEQSERNRLPEVLEPQTFDVWLQQIEPSKTLLFHPAGQPPSKLLQPMDSPYFCFGPEGGFSDREVAMAQGQGVSIISLGERILRAETAPIVVLASQLLI